jgi:hypothetical protein
MNIFSNYFNIIIMGACFCHNNNNEVKARLPYNETKEEADTNFNMKKEISIKKDNSLKQKTRSMPKNVSIKAQTFVIHKNFSQFLTDYEIMNTLGSGIDFITKVHSVRLRELCISKLTRFEQLK